MLLYRRYALVRIKRDDWRIWDVRDEVWRGKFLAVDDDYSACSRDVAAMRVRDAKHMYCDTKPMPVPIETRA